MAAPNIVNVSTILGKTATQSLSTGSQTLVNNSSSSNKVFKINALYVANSDGSLAWTASILLSRSAGAFQIASNVSIPANSTLDLISKSIYLEEGDSITTTSNNNSGLLKVVCSYEEIS